MAQAAQVKDITKREPTISERFTGMVIKEFSGTVGDGVQLSEDQKRLAQHLFVKIDAALNALESKRLKENKNGEPIVWNNINMQKLALDAMHRIELGLDALIPNHIHPIPYWNGKQQKYDLDLRIGYVGKDYYRRTVALDQPKDIIYELVYSTDKFVALKKSINNKIESFEFEIKKPFDRGDILGGFGYIVYEDETKNKLVLVTAKDFDKSKSKGNNVFWSNYPTEMKYKTLVTRVTDKLTIDPKKVSASYGAVEEQELEDSIEAEITENANQTPIDTTATVVEPGAETPAGETTGDQGTGDEPPMTDEEKAEIIRKEQEEAGKQQQDQGKQGQQRGPSF
jgi:recombination protein RecT